MSMRAMPVAATSPSPLAWAAVLILLGVGAFAAEAASPCSASYCVGQCARACTDPDLGGATTTCENWLRENGVQGDSDGVDNWSDNCVCKNNTNQADCDGDGKGDVCDTLNGVFQPADRWRSCASDKDLHAGFFEIEVTEHRKYTDVSSCHAAPRWNQRESSSYCLPGTNEEYCCEQSVQNSEDLFICHPVGQYICNPDTMP